jgi:argininosuccinate lyase
LWDKGNKTHEGIISFTCDRDRYYDERLAPYDIIAGMAHALMLEECGIISSDEKVQLLSGLSALFAESLNGKLHIDREYEDIHSYVEFRLRDIAGEAAGKINTGRSRNDQVITDIHLWLRHQSFLLAAELYKLSGLFLELSMKHEAVLMPGFTHMQTAMVSSFGLWFAAFAESLGDDLQLLADASSFANASPLGTAAGYGTTIAVDRELTASLLQFERLMVSSPYAQMSRGRTEKIFAGAIASAANTLGKFASDVVLFMSPGYGFVTLPDDLTTGSSIMPQKKNPDLFELIRARCNKLQGMPTSVALMTTGLPPGYNRDYQELKSVIFNAFDEIMELVTAVQGAAAGLIINHDIMKDGRYNDIYSVEEANRMALRGIPFRDAYREAARMAGSGKYKATSPSDYTHIGSIGNTGSSFIKERTEKIMDRFSKAYSPQELFDSIKSNI